MATPRLLQGTIGGRRGPLLLTVLTLFVAWFVARGTLPKLRHAFVGILIAGLAVSFVWSQRGTVLRVGSNEQFESQTFENKLYPARLSQGHFYVVGSGSIVRSYRTGNYGWGKNYVKNLVFRPIPYQLWPGQYRFVNRLYSSFTGSSHGYSRDIFKWRVPAGTTPGPIADAFNQLSWGMLLVFLLLGRMYGWWWKKFRQQGGVWTILYGSLLALTPYMATQSLSAFLYRLLFFTVPVYVIWRLFITPRWAGAEEAGALDEETPSRGRNAAGAHIQP